MNSTLKFFLRYFIVLLLSIGLSWMGIYGHTGAVQALFTVLGVSFSIAMSIIISFDLSNILNDGYRMAIRASIKNTRNCIIVDFIFATMLLLLSSLQGIAEFKLEFSNHVLLDFQTFVTCAIVMSIIYEVYNFIMIHNLHDAIADKVVEEKKQTH